MKNVYLSIILLLTFITYSQDLHWVKGFHGTDQMFSTSIALDSYGNVFTTGYFYNTVDFDPGSGVFNLTTNNNSNAYISKLDINGAFVWAKNIVTNNFIGAESITIDNFNNVYTTGSFVGIADFDPGVAVYNYTSTGATIPELYISKLDGNGNFIWAKNISGTNTIKALDIVTDKLGFVYVAGEYYGTADFDPGAGIFNMTALGYDDVFILKLNANGDFIWAKTMGGIGGDRVKSISLDDFNNVYTTGDFQNTVDFDPGANIYNLVSNGGYNTYISKLNTNGNFVWAKSLSSGSGTGAALAVDSIGSVYTTGGFSGSCDFDPGLGVYNIATTNGGTYISKLDSGGNFVWAKSFSNSFGGGTGSYYNIEVDTHGYLFIAGSLHGTVDFDTGPNVFSLTATGQQDLFFSKLNSNGSLIWAKRLENSVGDYNYNRAILLDKKSNIYSTGLISGTTDFDPSASATSLTSIGFYDAFVLKLSSCSNISSISNKTVCTSYTSPSGNYTWSTSGTYNDTIANLSGCDSIITVNLTIDKSSSFAYTTNSMTATFNLTGTGCNTFLWDFGNGNTSTLNSNPVVTYSTAGTYGVCLQCNGQPSACVKCLNITVPSNTSNGVGIEELNDTNGISIYPNPSTGILNIELTNFIETDIALYNTNGQCVYARKLYSNMSAIDLSDFSSGIYSLHFKNSTGIKVQKIILNR